MLKTIGIAAALVTGIAASGALLVAHAAPEPASQPAAPNFQPKSAAAKSFDPTCSADEQVGDSRAEPKWVSESFAGDNCLAPSPPKPLNGYTLNLDQAKAGIAAQKQYVAAANAYQQCIANFVAARQAAAAKKPMEVALLLIENHRIAASEAATRTADARMKISLRQYNEAGSEDCK